MVFTRSFNSDFEFLSHEIVLKRLLSQLVFDKVVLVQGAQFFNFKVFFYFFNSSSFLVVRANPELFKQKLKFALLYLGSNSFSFT